MFQPTTDRPDLELRDRVRAVKRLLAEKLGVKPLAVDELMRSYLSNPEIDAVAILTDALTNKRAAGPLGRLLFDLTLEQHVELIVTIVDERIADELRTIETRQRGSEEGASEEREPDALDAVDAELLAGAEKGDAWEGD